MTLDPALSLERVTKRYNDVQAVSDLSFTAQPGRILGFLGPNGAGKTTTLRMILGLAPPSAGTIRVLGTQGGQITQGVRNRIGFLPEERGLYRRMTPLDAIVFFASLKGAPMAGLRAKAEAMLAEQGLKDAARRPIRKLSKGMAQKVQLLSAIAHEPDLVLLDEPFSGLDPVNQQSLEAIVRGLAARGATVVFSTHVMQHAERLCDQVVLLAKGRKVFDGSVAQARAAAPRRLMLEGRLDRADVLALPGVSTVEAEEALDGGERRLVARLSAGGESQEALKAAFARGLGLSRFEAREPSLHDAFIVLTEDAA